MSIQIEPFVVADRIRQTTTTTGTGNITFSGTYPGYAPFSSFMTTNDYTSYCISDPGNDAYEVGIGKFLSGGTFERTYVYASSESGGLVNLQAGTKEIFCPLIASLSKNLAMMSGQDFIIRDLRRVFSGGTESETVFSNNLSVFSMYNVVSGGEVIVNNVYNKVGSAGGKEFLLVKCAADGITFTNSGNIVTPTARDYTIQKGDHALLFYNGTKWEILFTSTPNSAYYVHNSGTFFHVPYNSVGVLIDMAAVNDNVLLALSTNTGPNEQTYKVITTGARKVVTLNNSGSGDASGRKLFLANDYITVRFQNGDDGYVINEFIAKHIAIATRTSNQAIVQNSTTIVDLQTTETDNAGNIDLSANTITPLKDAQYQISGQVKFDTMTNNTKVNLYVFVNGVQVHESQGYAVAGSIILDINITKALVAGEPVTLRVRHNDSTSRNLNTARLEVVDQGT